MEMIDLVRTAALGNFTRYMRRENPQIKEITASEPLAFDHWIMLILVKSKVLNVSFQTHFTSPVARKLAATGLNLPEKQLTYKICHDFMQEFCNLTAGSIKKHLLDTCLRADSFDMTVQVPEKVPAYDEVNLFKDLKKNKLHDCFGIEFSAGDEITCATHVKIFDYEALSAIKQLDISVLTVDDEGQVEFL